MVAIYDSRHINAHGIANSAELFLINEAPGPSEAESGIPSFGRQGANIYHALRAAGISWAVDHPKFKWRVNFSTQNTKQDQEKEKFLKIRANHITCSNAFPRWPKPSIYSNGFCAPSSEDVISTDNIKRIKDELCVSHRSILICGYYAYLACIGNTICNPSTRECTALTEIELKTLNDRLNSEFKAGWYMGHTRRWLMRKNETASALRRVANFLGWNIEN